MTEKQYGGSTSFGFKSSSTSNKSPQGPVSSAKTEKKDNKAVFKTEFSKEVIENYLKAGKICSEVREYVKTIVKKGVLLLEIAEKTEQKIEELGGKNAFPANTSIDEIAAHYTPVMDDLTVASGLLKVDFGVEIGGYIADNSISFDLSEDKRYSDMISFNQKILDETLDSLQIGSPVKLVGNTISRLISEDGRYKIITNLSGHSLDKDDLHAGTSVVNIRNENELPLEDIAIAIEPFITEGKGEIYEGKLSEIFILQNMTKLPRDRDARILLEFIKNNYRTKPFCKRWIQKEGLPKINFSLSMLVRDGILYNFPILIEKDKKPVSQAEHSILFADKVYVYTR